MEDMDFSTIFLDELREKLNEVAEALKNYFENKDITFLRDLYRVFHTIKGSAGLVNFQGFQKVAHRIEEIFKDIYENKRELSTHDTARLMKIISVLRTKKDDLTKSEIEKILKFLNGEIENLDDEISPSLGLKPYEIGTLRYREILESVVRAENNIILNNINLAIIELKNLKNYLNNLIQDEEFIPIARVLDGFENLVFQESILNNKKVKLIIECQDLRIPIKDASSLRDSLIHIVRNSISHGIEPSEERKKLGKPEKGTIKIKVYLDTKDIIITVEDDGAGIDLNEVREKAKLMGYSTDDPIELIFQAGFSTKDSSDLSSGRGIGLYAAKTFTEEKGGSIKVQTDRGKGTKFILRFPATFVIKKVLVVKSGEDIFAIDLSEILSVHARPFIFELDNSKVLKYNNKLYELIFLGNSKSQLFGVLLKNSKALLIDKIIGIFDGQLVYQRSDISEYFVKNIFAFPVPVIDFKLLEKNIPKYINSR